MGNDFQRNQHNPKIVPLSFIYFYLFDIFSKTNISDLFGIALC